MINKSLRNVRLVLIVFLVGCGREGQLSLSSEVAPLEHGFCSAIVHH